MNSYKPPWRGVKKKQSQIDLAIKDPPHLLTILYNRIPLSIREFMYLRE